MWRVALLLPLLLGGCFNQWYTYAGEDAMLIHNASRDFLTENVQDRRAIRAACREIVIERAEELRDSGKTSEALRLLDKAYPPLVTPNIIQQRDLEILNTAAMCAAARSVTNDNEQ